MERVRNNMPIGTVNAIGNSPNNSVYDFTDEVVAFQQTGVVYYRLKMFDKNGVYRYSNIVRILLPGIQSKVTVAPNPVSSDVNASIIAAESCQVDWEILDNAGRVLLQNRTSLEKGKHTLIINISQVASGSCYLTIKGSKIDLKTQFQKL